MREIEFRGKTSNEVCGFNKIKDGTWVYGYYRDKIGLPVISQFENCNYIDYEIDRETLGQYTGLKDKNGKKIFEGDIVKYHTESISFEADTIGVVEFCEGTFGIASNKKQHFLSFYNMSAYVRYVEVIDNIYDNPKLLEVEK